MDSDWAELLRCPGLSPNQEAGLHLTETEYMSLLSANMRAGRWEEGHQLLKNMAETVDSVSQEMCKVLRGWFASDVHARTGRQWEVASTPLPLPPL